MVDLARRVALATGAGSDLGRAHASLLAVHGAAVMVTGVRRPRDRRGDSEGAAARDPSVRRQAPFSASKMALVALMRTVAIEGIGRDVPINGLAATRMTDDVLMHEFLGLLPPEQVAAAMVRLSAKSAPAATILCAGAGNFSLAHVTMTSGITVGTLPDADARVLAGWNDLSDRGGEFVPDAGPTHAQWEVSTARTRLQKAA